MVGVVIIVIVKAFTSAHYESKILLNNDMTIASIPVYVCVQWNTGQIKLS